MEVIAGKVGVSRNAVSLALRNHPSISPAVRARIQAAADRLGYQRNPAFGELMSQMRRKGYGARQATLALFNAHEDAGAFRDHPTIPEYVKGCQRRATLLGYDLDTFWLHDPGIDTARWIQILEARGIRGMLLIGLMTQNRLPKRLLGLFDHFPAVVTGVRTREPVLSFACVDHHALALQAVEQVLALGYRRPALVLDPTIDLLVEGRFSAGFMVGQRQLSESDRITPWFHVSTDVDEPAGFRKWLRQCQPDVIFTLYNSVRRWIENDGLRIPRDIGLVQLEWRSSNSDWAGMEQHNDLVGEAAVDMLTGMILRGEQGPPLHPRATLVEPTWRNGSTARHVLRMNRVGAVPSRRARHTIRPFYEKISRH